MNFTLRIGSRRFPVRRVSGLKHRGQKLDGKVDYHPPEISVCRKLEEFDAHSTLLHEILHVIDDCYGLSLGEPGVLTLETALIQILQDNPKWARAFFRAVEKSRGV